MSQAMALKEYLDEAGHSLEAVFAGQRNADTLPEYFVNFFAGKVLPFHSPYFLRTPNKKGIYVGRTLLYNLLYSFRYIREIARIRKTINSLHPDVVFNFYDVVGALSLRKLHSNIERIGIGHHFYHHLKGYYGLRGMDRHLLAWHTRIIMNSCDRVLALSYTGQEGNSQIEVVPPLIRKAYRDMKHQSGNRYLVYLLMEGFLYDLIRLAREDVEFQADVFTDLVPGIELPSGIKIFRMEGGKFRERMASCKGLITTAGFDTTAEAAYLGIPQAVIPARNHFEQLCNSKDMEDQGIGVKLDHLVPGIEQALKQFDNADYRRWVDQCGELILKTIAE